MYPVSLPVSKSIFYFQQRKSEQSHSQGEYHIKQFYDIGPRWPKAPALLKNWRPVPWRRSRYDLRRSMGKGCWLRQLQNIGKGLVKHMRNVWETYEKHIEKWGSKLHHLKWERLKHARNQWPDFPTESWESPNKVWIVPTIMINHPILISIYI